MRLSGGVAGSIIGIVISLVIASIVLPIGLEELEEGFLDAEGEWAFENFQVLEPLLLTLFPVLIVIAVIFRIVQRN